MVKQFSRDCLCACKVVILPFCIYCHEIKIYQTLTISAKCMFEKQSLFPNDWLSLFLEEYYNIYCYT